METRKKKQTEEEKKRRNERQSEEWFVCFISGLNVSQAFARAKPLRFVYVKLCSVNVNAIFLNEIYEFLSNLTCVYCPKKSFGVILEAVRAVGDQANTGCTLPYSAITICLIYKYYITRNYTRTS